MINNALLPAESFLSPSIPGHATLRNAFLAVKNDISIREPGVEPQPACGSRTDCVPSSEQVLKVVGYREMTAANCHLFRKMACAAWHGQVEVEIDLSQTTLIDCAGLGALIAVRNLTLKCKGVTRLMNPAPPVQQMLDLTRTGRLFDIINTADESFVSGPPAHN